MNPTKPTEPTCVYPSQTPPEPMKNHETRPRETVAQLENEPKRSMKKLADVMESDDADSK